MTTIKSTTQDALDALDRLIMSPIYVNPELQAKQSVGRSQRNKEHIDQLPQVELNNTEL